MISKEWIYSLKRIFKILIDVVLFALSLIISYKLRLEHNLSSDIQSWFWTTQLPFVLPIVIALRISFFFIFQIYSKMWRYTEINEILELTKPIALTSIFLALPRMLGFSAYQYIFAIPISIIVMDSALCIIFLSSARLLRKWQIANRAIRKRQRVKDTKAKKRTLLIGAGEAGQELVRKVIQHPELDIEIVCALDDDPRKQNIKITNQVKVVGKIK